MSFTKIFEDRNYFEQFKSMLPDGWMLDIPESRQYKFFQAIGKEFIYLRELGRQIAISRWIGVPKNSPNVSPEDIDVNTEKINVMRIGGDSLLNLGQLLNQDLYEVIEEREVSYRQRLIGTVGGIFGGGSKPSIKQALEFATIRFDGLGAHPEGYTPEIIETSQPRAKFGDAGNPPTIISPQGVNYYYYNFGEVGNIPSENKEIYDLFGLPNNYSKWGSESNYNTDMLHFIVKFTMDNNPFNGNVAITGNLDDGYYNSEDDKKYLGTQSGYAGIQIGLGNKGGGNTFNPILIFDLEPLLDYGISEVSECYLDFYININFTGSGWGGFYAHLIDDNNPSYTDEESGEPSYLEDNKVLFSDDVAGSGWYSDTIILGNPNIADLVNMYLQRDRSEGETRMGIYLKPVSDTDSEFLGLERIEHNGGNEAFIDITYFPDYPTDYEYWGGKYINNLIQSNFNENYVNNYLFLRSVVQAMKLAGVTFEIQIEEV